MCVNVTGSRRITALTPQRTVQDSGQDEEFCTENRTEQKLEERLQNASKFLFLTSY